MKETPKDKVTPETAPQPNTAPQYLPPQQPVQYVNIVNQKSLEGLSGWLVFWLVVFALSGLFYIIFFSGLLASPEPMKEAFGVVSVIFMPILIVSYIASAVLIAMRKKLAIMTSIATFGVVSVYFSIMMVISASKASSPAKETIPMTIGIVLTILVTNALFALYFFVSKRVKATLTN